MTITNEQPKSFNDDLKRRIAEFKGREISKVSKELIDLVAELRCNHDMNFLEISQELGAKSTTIFNIIRDYPVSQGATKMVKGALTRDERRLRNAEMVRMNSQEGLTLEAIAEETGISKQRVSAIFKKLKYKPLDGEAIDNKDSKKHAKELAQGEINALKQQVETLKTQLAKQRQDEATAKYYYGKELRQLRQKLISKIMDCPTKEDIRDFKALKKSLRTAYNNFNGNTVGSKQLSQILDRADDFEYSEKYKQLTV